MLTTVYHGCDWHYGVCIYKGYFGQNHVRKEQDLFVLTCKLLIFNSLVLIYTSSQSCVCYSKQLHKDARAPQIRFLLPHIYATGYIFHYFYTSFNIDYFHSYYLLKISHNSYGFLFLHDTQPYKIILSTCINVLFFTLTWS